MPAITSSKDMLGMTWRCADRGARLATVELRHEASLASYKVRVPVSPPTALGTHVMRGSSPLSRTLRSRY